MEHVKKLITRTLPVPYWLIALVTVAVTVYAGSKADFGSHYRLQVLFADAGDVKPGAAVRLDGIQIGQVEQVKLAPLTSPPDPTHHLELTLRIDHKYRSFVTTESEASLVCDGLLGDRYVSITRGFSGTPLAAGAELKSVNNEAIVSRAAEMLVDAFVQKIKSNLNLHGK
ncbi:MAG: MCE family protein [Candidatus Acidiferrales bacterium]|jgi:ABC-type transporter Mla subunit MlaD